MALTDGECFLADSSTTSDILTQADVEYYFHSHVEAADRAELQSFVNEKVFKLIYADQADQRPIDAVWVRRWKLSNGVWIVKSRLCIRGFLDPQRHLVSTRSTTASRLSQRLVLSISALMGFTIESWDVGVAFLKGFSFKQLEIALRKKGIKTTRRRVYLSPPLNVWRHFRSLDCPYKVPVGAESLWLLELLKAMYGLNDAPLAWQLCLVDFLISELCGRQSVFDENFFFWFDRNYDLEAIATAHVDDNGVGARPQWLNYAYDKFEKRFGQVKRQRLPFTHVGTTYSSDGKGGYYVDQRSFVEKLIVHVIPSHWHDDDELSKHGLYISYHSLPLDAWCHTLAMCHSH